MRFAIGLILVVCGFAAGLYAGVWWAFIGGIVDVITQVRADELVPIKVGIGVAKVVFSGLIGWLAAIVLIIPGWALISAEGDGRGGL